MDTLEWGCGMGGSGAYGGGAGGAHGGPSGAPGGDGVHSMMVDEDYMELMTDTLFSTISSNQPLYFPDPREIGQSPALSARVVVRSMSAPSVRSPSSTSSDFHFSPRGQPG